MNVMEVFLINLVIMAIVFHFISKKIYFLDIFNRETKCYFLKPIDEIELTSFQKRFVDIKDGKYVLYNERYKFIDYGIVMPCLLLATTWPFLYYMPNNIFGWCVLSVIPIEWYEAIVIYLRMKFNKSLTLLDENWPYNLNYTAFAFQFNRLTNVLMAMCIFSIIASNALLAKVILVVLLLRMHVFIFMDKIDGYFGWNILELEKLNRLLKFEPVFFYIMFLLIIYSIALGPINVFIY